MNPLTILSIYFGIGFPIALSFALIISNAPIFKRLLLFLVFLPFWPVFVVWLGYIALQKHRIAHICGWCGEFMGYGRESHRAHVLKCDSHPWVEVVHSIGFDPYWEDGKLGLIGHGCIYLPGRVRNDPRVNESEGF